ncbi:guanylate-binding protein 3-like [Dendronephthya gigantea]|uniref:guanylate-binding protein 3-like n=1 Tax=Dendronephthya gigantea TaxID=151771 RepID=UPI00106B0E97|nr:guanylate-binding protein 3-like [Dendronephthya gigantea]
MRQSEEETNGAIPLCIPNNYKWNDDEAKLQPVDNINRTGLAVCTQGLEILRSITGPVCIVCVVGPARTGKSYLLGQLQGSTFRLGHTMKAETMGIWIGKKVIRKSLTTGEETTLVFLDSEGIGSIDSKDSTDATDNQIFTLSVLLSSLLIYNSKNVPNNSDLEKLHYVSKLSYSIRVRSDAENTSEDVAKFKEYSPEFFWLIRDVTLDITNENKKQVDIKTYLEQKILKNENGISQAANQRNEIRRSIKSFFRSINAFTLPVPSHERDVLKNMGKPKNNKNINGEFLVKLDILKTIISEKYHSKKGINNSLLTGTQLADMLESYVHALNTKGYIPDWQSAWELTVKMAYKRAGEKAIMAYEKILSPLSRTFPCDENAVMKKHEIGIEEAIQVFRKETLMDTDVEHIEANLKEFTKKCVSYDGDGRCVGGLLFQYLTENREKSETLCEEVIKKLTKENLEPALENNHQPSCEEIITVIKTIEDKYWSSAIGPAAEYVFKKSLEERKEQVIKFISQLEDYNNEIEKERSEKNRLELSCREKEKEKERLQRQKEAQAKQHLNEV